jgi:hypothetical protein
LRLTGGRSLAEVENSGGHGQHHDDCDYLLHKINLLTFACGCKAQTLLAFATGRNFFQMRRVP